MPDQPDKTPAAVARAVVDAALADALVPAAARTPGVRPTLTAEQATALYDLVCWALDTDQDHGNLWLTGPSAVEPTVLKAAATALIDGGAEGGGMKGDGYV